VTFWLHMSSPLLYGWGKIFLFFLCRNSKAWIRFQVGPWSIVIYYHQGLTITRVDGNNQHHHVPFYDFETKHYIFKNVEIRILHSLYLIDTMDQLSWRFGISWTLNHRASTSGHVEVILWLIVFHLWVHNSLLENQLLFNVSHLSYSI